MPIHLVYIFFCLKVLFFSRKKIKIDTTPHYRKWDEIQRYMGLINVLLQNISDKFKSDIERQNISE